MINIKIVVSEKTTIEIQTDDVNVVTKICETFQPKEENVYTVSLDYMGQTDEYDTFLVSGDEQTSEVLLNEAWPFPETEKKCGGGGCSNCGGCSVSKGTIYAD